VLFSVVTQPDRYIRKRSYSALSTCSTRTQNSGFRYGGIRIGIPPFSGLELASPARSGRPKAIAFFFVRTPLAKRIRPITQEIYQPLLDWR